MMLEPKMLELCLALQLSESRVIENWFEVEESFLHHHGLQAWKSGY
jgi:hypothetical protein